MPGVNYLILYNLWLIGENIYTVLDDEHDGKNRTDLFV